MILYLTFGLCALGAALIVYRYDLYDREPVPMLLGAVALGALGMAAAGRLEELTFTGREGAAAMAAVAALEEEGLKLLAVLVIALVASRTFNDPMDGLIYGSMVGLGAALEEGVAVLRAREPSGRLLPPEELVRLCGHLVMGGLGGFGVGCARLTRPGWPWAVGLGFLAAFALHFGWDLQALRAETATGASRGGTLLSAALMLTGFLLYGWLVVTASRWSQQMFSPGVIRRLGSWPFRGPGPKHP